MNEDKVIKLLLKRGKNLEWIKDNMVTKKDHREVMGTLDILVGLARKKDQELTFMGERVTRVEDDVRILKKATGVA
ncbi:MAG: hypothetical protein GF349_02750 [Candidatus Magasanikbacteria bacterium]|nr:hypothetical protein [Candidatus Magasanikbacteria bacterium]